MNRFSMSPVFACVVTLTLAACASDSDLFESKRIDYKKARPSSTLEVPPDLTAPRADDRYAVPDASGARGAATFSNYSADRAGQPGQGSSSVLAGTLSDSMRIERAGSQRWLVVRSTPEAIWPQLREFWVNLGFTLKIDSAEIGVLETDWRENRANIREGGVVRWAVGKVFEGLYSTSERDKFRSRIELGEEGTVEIYISHRGVEEVYANRAKDSTVWQPRPADPELEIEMLRRLMVRLGAEEARAQSVLAEAQRVDRAQVQQAGEDVFLQVDEPFDRAWRRVGLALDRVNFTVEDRDRAKGLYYVRYIDPDSDINVEPGFFAKLFGGDKKREGGEYRVRVEGQGDQSIVTVLVPEGSVDQSPTARRILNLLQKELR